MPGLLHRRSIRFKSYDYRQEGAYFVTLSTLQHLPLFGQYLGETVELNSFGQLVDYHWQQLPVHFPITVDEWIIMPDHMHGILIIEDCLMNGEIRQAGNRSTGTTSEALSAVIQNFKMVTSLKINRMRKTPGESIWQRNYYEHIIRSEESLNSIRQYIIENPLRHYLRKTNE